MRREDVLIGFSFTNKREISFESFTNTNSHHITRKCLPKTLALILYSIQTYSALPIIPQFQPKEENEDWPHKSKGLCFYIDSIAMKKYVLPK